LEQPVAAAEPAPEGIVTPRQRAAMAQSGVAVTAVTAPGDDLDSWTHSGDEALAIAQREQAAREQAAAERRARGYWPRMAELIPPSAQYPDRYQADYIITDEKLGPAFYKHTQKNPRTGRLDVHEPCPKEWDNCPLCPPAGQFESRYGALLTGLNIMGYTVQKGERAGTFIPVTQELMFLEPAEQAFFAAIHRERGTLRGLQVTMTRADKNSPWSGVPSNPRFHTEETLRKFLTDQGMMRPKMTQSGEVLDAREDWMMFPIRYADFLHRPSGADLRARYQGGAGAPVGARTASDPQWGGGRYEPGATPPPGQGANGGWGQTVSSTADLDDDVPF
jgi:hypothetical protein